MTWGTCAACEAKDSEIAHLRELVASLRKENLALVDLRAANVTFPRAPAAPQAKPATDMDPVHISPAQVRDTLYVPPLSAEKVEELFDLEEQIGKGAA